MHRNNYQNPLKLPIVLSAQNKNLNMQYFRDNDRVVKLISFFYQSFIRYYAVHSVLKYRCRYLYPLKV